MGSLCPLLGSVERSDHRGEEMLGVALTYLLTLFFFDGKILAAHIALFVHLEHTGSTWKNSPTDPMNRFCHPESQYNCTECYG